MSQTANSMSGEEFTRGADGALEMRIFRVMIVTVAVAVIASAILAPWRVTSGLLLGGLLSLLNHHWLRSSIAAVFNIEQLGKRPRLRVWRFVLRYFVVAALVLAAYKLQITSLPATIIGLCSFVPALLFEASRQFYFVIIRGEETY
jgi:ATP synthase I chain